MNFKKCGLGAIPLVVVIGLAAGLLGCGEGANTASSSGEVGLCTERRTLTPDQCPNYSELTSDATPGVADRSSSIRITRESELCGETETRTYEWKFFYTPGAGVVDPGTPEEIAAFYEGLGPEETFAPVAYTNPNFAYFQCIYAYSEGYAFALNLEREAMPPKQEQVGFSFDDCPPVDLLKTKCAEEDGSAPIEPLDYDRFTFAFQGITSDGNSLEPQSGEKWNQFCSETVANSNGHSSNLVDVSPTESQAFCTYWWGEFSWTHGLTTNFSTSDLLTEP